MIFAMFQLLEKHQGQNCELCTIFVDLTKNFNTAPPPSKGLLRIMSKFGCPIKFIQMKPVPGRTDGQSAGRGTIP